MINTYKFNDSTTVEAVLIEPTEECIKDINTILEAKNFRYACDINYKDIIEQMKSLGYIELSVESPDKKIGNTRYISQIGDALFVDSLGRIQIYSKNSLELRSGKTQLDLSIDQVQSTALSKQVGGDHYKNFAIQPVKFITANNLGYIEGNVIKYLCRHEHKNGRKDLEKAIHYIEMLMDLKYPIHPEAEGEQHSFEG